MEAASCVPIEEIPAWLPKRIARKRKMYSNMETATDIKISAKDLRIGDWIRTLSAYDAPREIQVHSIEATTINGTIPFDDLEGVRLDGALKKMGFNSASVASFQLQPLLFLTLKKDESEWIVCLERYYESTNYITIDFPNKISFFHQLQNLYQDIANEDI